MSVKLSRITTDMNVIRNMPFQFVKLVTRRCIVIDPRTIFLPKVLEFFSMPGKNIIYFIFTSISPHMCGKIERQRVTKVKVFSL